MKKFFVIVSVLFCIVLSSCINSSDSYGNNQYSGDVVDKQPTGSTINAQARYLGSTKSLEGDICIITVYLREYGQEDFSRDELNYYVRCLNNACNYLSSCARKYGKQANFVCVDAFNGQTQYVNKIDDTKSIIDVYCNVFGIGYYNTLDNIAKDYGCDNYMVIFYTNRPGGRCNHSESSYAGSNFYCEGTVANRQTNNNFTTTIAHEMLHNFGAIDLYNMDLSSLDYGIRQKVYSSIMYRCDVEPSGVRLDEFTAYMVGLTDNEEDWYQALVSQY